MSSELDNLPTKDLIEYVKLLDDTVAKVSKILLTRKDFVCVHPANHVFNYYVDGCPVKVCKLCNQNLGFK